jgi:hypothetical protein
MEPTMPAETEAYKNSQSALRQHEKTIEQELSRVRTFASWVLNNNYDKVIVDGAEMPTELLASRSANHFNPQGWPSGERIAGLLVQWHKLHKIQRDAWQNLPPDQREGLTPPLVNASR